MDEDIEDYQFFALKQSLQKLRLHHHQLIPKKTTREDFLYVNDHFTGGVLVNKYNFIRDFYFILFNKLYF